MAALRSTCPDCHQIVDVDRAWAHDCPGLRIVKDPDKIRQQNAMTKGTTAAEIIMCPVFRLGFADQRQTVFREDWEWEAVIEALGLKPAVLGKGSWSYERGQQFARLHPDVSEADLGQVFAGRHHALISRLSRDLMDDSVL